MKRKTISFVVLLCLFLVLFADVVLLLSEALTKFSQSQSPSLVKQHILSSATFNTISSTSTESPENADCRDVSVFVDHALTHEKRLNTPRPIISIIYITKRPGGYDFLLNSLAQQEGIGPNSFELICVDELASFRAREVYLMAEKLGVNLVAVIPSKPKSEAYSWTKFNIYNAINTGVLLARGTIVTFIMDFAWIPASYVRRTIEFYSDPVHSKSLLAYPEHFFHLHMRARPPLSVLHDPTLLTVFPQIHSSIVTASSKTANTTGIHTPLFKSLANKHPDGIFGLGYKRPVDLVEEFYAGRTTYGFEKQPLENARDHWGEFWELSFASVPFSCLEEINGAEEEFDVGDDCHEVNIRLRCKKLGYDLWIDGQSVVECMWHKNELDTETALWNRYQKDTVQNLVLGNALPNVRSGARSARSRGHDFNLTSWRGRDCASRL